MEYGPVNLMNRMKIGTRLTAGFSVLLVMTLLAAGIGWWQLRLMKSEFDAVTVNTLPAILMAGDIRSNAEEIRRNQIRLVSELELSARKRIISDIKDTRGLYQTLYESYGKDLVKGEQDRQLWKDAGDTLAAYEALSVKIEADAMVDPEGDPPDEAATRKKALEISEQLQGAVYGDAFSAFAAVVDRLDKLKGFNVQISREAEASGQTVIMRGQLVLAATALISLVLGALLSFTLTRSVVVPLGGAVKALRRVADGNLDSEIDATGNDELTTMLTELGRMQESLRTVVTDIRQTSESVSASSGEIAAGNLDLSNRTEQQASQLQEAASSMAQLTTTVRHNAETARQVDELAGKASAAARRGGDVVSKVVTTMQGIQQSSDRISHIISVIDGIAFQTNILALNAAVEAARAGEQGRGFAVVAAEVRSLAQRSAGAAKEIKTLIFDSAEKVTGGSQLVTEAGRSIVDIQSQVDKVTGLISEILSSATAQSAGIVQVNRAVGELDEATQQNAALVEQASAASESLKQQALRLVDVVSVFRVRSEDVPPADGTHA